MLTSLGDNWPEGLYDWPTNITIFILAAVYFFSKIVIHKGWAKFNVRAIIFRSTGLIYIFPHKGGPADIHPFNAFDAFINSSANVKTGALSYTLFMSHRENKALMFSGTTRSDNTTQESVYMSWELIQQFMDISQPLPDASTHSPSKGPDG